MIKKIVALAATSLLLASCSVVGIRNAEEAPYEVVKDEGAIEVRRYSPIIMATTRVDGDYDESSREGFGRLAAYIFGDNRTSEDIAMTAPVLQERVGSEWWMAFVMPSSYTMDSLPAPLDPTIKTTEIPSRTVAVIRYSGILSQTAIDLHAFQLQAWIEANGYQALSAPRSAGYDPPWTLPFLRRNEVHVDIG